MKNYFSLFIMLMISVLTMAQVKLSKDFSFETGKAFKVVDASDKQYFSVSDGIVVSVKTRGEMVTLQKYDASNMKELGRKVYEDFPKYTKVQDLLQIEDRLYYVFEAYDKKAKVHSVYSREINYDELTFSKSQKLITSSRPVNAGPMVFGKAASGFSFPVGPKFEVKKSFDESKIMIKYRLKPKSKKDAVNYDELGFFVFDNEFNNLWGKEQKMPYTEAKMNNLAYGVAKDGTAFMLAYLREDKKIELFSVSEDDFAVHPLDVEASLVFQKFDLKEDDEGNMACVGFYANGIDVKFTPFGGFSTSFNTNGIYYFKADKKGAILESHNYEFSLDFINEYKTAREKSKSAKREKKGKAGIGDLTMQDFIIEKDGSILLIGERAYVRNEMYGTKQKTVWHYSNVVFTKISPNGEIVWMKKLPKNQAGTRGQGGMGVKYIKGDGAHYILYLDNVKNAKLVVGKAPTPHKDGMGGYLTAYKIDDATGDVEKHSIFKCTGHERCCCPSVRHLTNLQCVYQHLYVRDIH